MTRARGYTLLGVTVAMLAALVVGFAFPDTTYAHATLGSTDPPANEIVSTSPGRVELHFTEPVEESYTTVILVDQTGTEVEGTSFAIDPNDATIVRMTIPIDLANGTYSVVWRTLSAADGHRFSGYFAFTIGSSADVRTVIPPTFDTAGGMPDWLNFAIRWFVYVTLSALAGLWFCWLVVMRPALGDAWQVAPGVVPRIRRYAMLAGLLYLIGAVLALTGQVWGQSSGDFFGVISETLAETRWGTFWVLRILFGALLTIGLMFAPWWWVRRARPYSVGLLIASALVVLPHAMVSHASASRYGRTAAIAMDYYHLIGMCIWFGGLLLIMVTMVSASDLLLGGRIALLVQLIPRFSTVALICWAALGISGFYAGYLQVGAWSGLTETEYGRSLLFKLITLAFVLVIAAINLVFVTRRIHSHATDNGARWWKRFGVLVGLEVIGVAIALVFVGRMTAIEPARTVLAEQENQQVISLELNGRGSTLSIAPGTAGPNHFRLDVGGELLADKTTATLLLHPPLDMAGEKLIALERTTGNSFEAHSAEMSVAGDWTMTVTLAQVGAFQWAADIVYPAPERQPGATSISYPAWTLNRTGLGGFLLVIAGLIGLSVGWRATTRSARREGYGLGAVALLAGCLLLVQGRTETTASGIPLDAPNPVPLTDQAIMVGQTSFQGNCIACHGVGGAGDGPAATGMNPPPANLLTGHAIYHSDAEFFNWIRNGKPGTAMPAFEDTLTDEQIWSTIHYIRSLQQEYADQGATPVVPDASPTP